MKAKKSLKVRVHKPHKTLKVSNPMWSDVKVLEKAALIVICLLVGYITYMIVGYA